MQDIRFAVSLDILAEHRFNDADPTRHIVMDQFGQTPLERLIDRDAITLMTKTRKGKNPIVLPFNGYT